MNIVRCFLPPHETMYAQIAARCHQLTMTSCGAALIHS
jgi:hypothetical protein